MDAPHALARQSLAILLEGQADSGAYVACPAFANYRHGWMRDGSFCAWAAGRSGHGDSAEAFFRWAARAVLGQASTVRSLIAGEHPSTAYLPARYALDGAPLNDGWWDRQHDGYGTWLWVMADHERRHGRLPDDLHPGIHLTAEYLLRSWRSPCHDWWEDADIQVHTSTTAAVAAGLSAASTWEFLPADLRERAAAAVAEIREAILTRGAHRGHLVKWLDDESATVDANLLACATPFGLLDPASPVVAGTLAAIEKDLLAGGVHRYPSDTFYGGGAWPVLSGLLGLHYTAIGRHDDAYRQLVWIAAQALPNGHLPEQTRDHMLHPDSLTQWLDRWGEPACPLLWSHAMYLLLALKLGEVSPADLAVPQPVTPGAGSRHRPVPGTDDRVSGGGIGPPSSAEC